SEVTPEVLLAAGLISRIGDGVKILANGDVKRALTVHAHAFSAAAAQKIVQAGGTAEMIGARDAERFGLVNGVFPPGELLGSVREVARTILSRGPLALTAALEAVLRGGEATLEEGLSVEADLFGLVSSTEDMKEGLRAFLEKRKAVFQGR
ncbi:MAG: uL15 family ribosomal protein, partial [Planctomycetota bacterium]